jgi:hypothetical protein
MVGYSYIIYWQIRTCFTYLLRLFIESVHVSLVAVDAEKLTMTSRRPPRQETQSTAAFLKPSKPFKPSGATAASDEVMGGLGIEPPTCLQDNFWDSYKTAQHSFGSFVSVFFQRLRSQGVKNQKGLGLYQSLQA